MYSTDHNEILHTSRQSNYRDVCKISLWSVQYILNSGLLRGLSAPGFTGNISDRLHSIDRPAGDLDEQLKHRPVWSVVEGAFYKFIWCIHWVAS